MMMKLGYLYSALHAESYGLFMILFLQCHAPRDDCHAHAFLVSR
jgi:hypothetical protein